MNKKDLLILSIGIFFTVIAWLIADVYHAATTEKIKSQVQLPVLKTYTINTSVLKTLKKRER